MARRFPWWIPAALLLLVPVLRHGTGFRGSPSVPGGPPLVGEQSLDSLLEAAGERPVLLNFWATWCSPCVHELPVLDSLRAEYLGRADFAAVSLGDPSLATLESFLQGSPVAMPVVWLSPEEAEGARERFGLPPVLPVTVLMAGGRETGRIVGASGAEEFRELLDGAPPADTPPDGAGEELHIYVVGPPDDPATAALRAEALALAGAEGVDLVDPGDPSGAALMEENRLPDPGRPYAQACAGLLCFPPAYTPEDLRAALESR
jgi:thiol-disulfide isomerase/thioredoxin